MSVAKFSILAATALGVVTLSGGSTRATVIHTVIAASGTAAPAGGNYSSFFIDPQLNSSGQVAFTGILTGGSGSTGVFRYTGGVGATIAVGGAPAPGGGTFAGFSGSDLNAGGDVSFNGSLNGGSSFPRGAFLHDGTAAALGLEGAASPGGGGNYVEFSITRLSDSGHVTYRSNLTGGPSTHGIYRHDGSTAIVLARQGVAAPAGGNYNVISLAQLDSVGRAAYTSSLSGGTSTAGVFRHDGTTASAVALQGAAAPAGGNFASFSGSFSLSPGGQLVFPATLTGGSSTGGLFRHDGITLSTVGIQGGTAPEGAGTYLGLFTPQQNDVGQISYSAAVTADVVRQGVFRLDGTTYNTVVLSGTTAPGTSGLFSGSGFNHRISNLGLVFLQATLTTGGSVNVNNDTGFWYGTDDSNLTLMVREGDTLFVNGANRVLADLPNFFAAYDAGVAWRASFTDGTSAVMYTLAIVPESKSWAMLGVLAIGAIGVRSLRRKSGA